MNRWNTRFNDKAFQDLWNDIKEKSKKVTLSADINEDHASEVLRLKKVIPYIDDLYEVIDPDFFPQHAWDAINAQQPAISNQMDAFLSDGDYNHIAAANNLLDKILQNISPYVVNAKQAAKAAGRAYNQFIKTLEEERAVLYKQNEELKADIQKRRDEITDIHKEVEETKDKIDVAAKLIFEGDGEYMGLEQSIKDIEEELQDKKTQIEEWENEIESYHTKLIVGGDEDAITRQIEEAKDEAIERRDAIKTAQEDSEKTLKELHSFAKKMFGYVNIEGETEEGLKQEIENRRLDLDSFRDEQRQKYKTILEEIESLLPNAASAGLASAYANMGKQFVWPIRLYTVGFCVALLGLIGVGVWLFKDPIITNEGVNYASIFHHLSIAAPIIWFAIFATNRRSEAKRLEQEYAHKTALAKSYISFKKQIDDLDDQDHLLLKKLLSTAIDSVGYNASQSLDGKHGDGLPFQTLLEKIVDKVPNASKVVVDKL